jgi:hypothetical protein
VLQPVRQRIQIAGEGWEATNRLWVAICADCDEQLTCAYIDSGGIRVQDGQFLAPFL